MCIVNGQTVHNCKTCSVHSIYHNESLTTDMPSLYDRIDESIKLRKDKVVFSEIKGDQIVEHTGGEIISMIDRLVSFIQWVTNDHTPETNTKKNKEESVLNQENQPVAIYLDTSLPYIISDIALQKLKVKSLSIYATHGKKAVENIIQTESVKLAFCESVINVEIIVLCNQKQQLVEMPETSEVNGKKQRIFYFDDIMSGKYENESSSSLNSPVIFDTAANFSFENETYNPELENKQVLYSDLKQPITQIYTSGTTSSPEPHTITAGNILSLIDSFFRGIEWNVFENIKFLLGEISFVESLTSKNSKSLREITKEIIIHNENIHLSYLPLSHIMERLLSYLFISVGVKIVYYGGNKKNLLEDIKKSKANFLVGAPRVFEHVGKKFEKKIFKNILRLKRWCCTEEEVFIKEIDEENSNFFEKIRRSILFFIKFIILKILDFIVFGRIKAKHNFKFLFTGGAFIRKDLKETISDFFGIPFYEAYGMSETCGVVSINNFLKKDQRLMDTVGWPIFPTEWKLHEGELIVRGPNIKEFSENEAASFIHDSEVKSKIFYERNLKSGRIDWDCSHEEKTNADKEATSDQTATSRRSDMNLTKKTNIPISDRPCFPAPENINPWYRTGDLAIIEQGLLKITGRKKNNFKLSQGEFIVPERIENAIGGDGIECTVMGKSSWDCLVGIIYSGGCKCENNLEVSDPSQTVLNVHVSTDSLTYSNEKDKTVFREENPYILTCNGCLSKQKEKLATRIAEIRLKRLLFGFEIPTKFLFITEPLVEIDGCYTKSTQKLMRNGVWELFGNVIEKIRQE